MNAFEFAQEIEKERQRQADRWADGSLHKLDEEDDKLNGIADWVVYLYKYSTSWLPGVLPPYDRKVLVKFKKSMLKVATLAYSAHEWAERKINGHTLHDG